MMKKYGVVEMFFTSEATLSGWKNGLHPILSGNFLYFQFVCKKISNNLIRMIHMEHIVIPMESETNSL